MPSPYAGICFFCGVTLTLENTSKHKRGLQVDSKRTHHICNKCWIAFGDRNFKLEQPHHLMLHLLSDEGLKAYKKNHNLNVRPAMSYLPEYAECLLVLKYLLKIYRQRT